jgi:hypothetical protein
MDIVLLVALVAVAISGFYVAAALRLRAKQTTEPLINRAVMQINGKIESAVNNQRQQIQDGLTKGQDLQGRWWKNAQPQFNRIGDLISDVKRETGKTQEQLGQLADRVEHIARQFMALEQREAGPAEAKTSLGGIPVTEVTDVRHPLVLAMLEAESNRARDGWGKPPQLYALAAKAAVLRTDPDLEAEIGEAPDSSLIPIKQEPLPPGEPIEVLAGVHWPDDVAGCVLVTELVVLPREAEGQAPQDPENLEQWASGQPGSQPARLAVGVSREGDYACILRLKGDDSVQFDPRLADDLVTALLETFPDTGLS